MTILAAMYRVDTAAADVCRWPTAALSVMGNTGQSTRRTAYPGDRGGGDNRQVQEWTDHTQSSYSNNHISCQNIS